MLGVACFGSGLALEANLRNSRDRNLDRSDCLLWLPNGVAKAPEARFFDPIHSTH